MGIRTIESVASVPALTTTNFGILATLGSLAKSQFVDKMDIMRVGFLEVCGT